MVEKYKKSIEYLKSVEYWKNLQKKYSLEVNCIFEQNFKQISEDRFYKSDNDGTPYVIDISIDEYQGLYRISIFEDHFNTININFTMSTRFENTPDEICYEGLKQILRKKNFD